MMFDNIEVISNPDGSATVIVDLDDDQLRQMESVLNISSKNTSDFEKAFEAFVNQAIKSYLQGG